MKKLFFLASALLCGVISASAVDYLVQTGKAGDAVWTDAAINKIKETSPNVKVISFDTTGVAKLPTTGEFWFAAGTYDFTESYDMKANTKLIGGFAGTETYATAPQKQNNKPYDYVNPTILNVVQSETSTIRLFKNDLLSGVDLTGLTIQNSKHTGNGGVYRPHATNNIKYCTFKNNSTTGDGGAILVYDGSATIEGCLFEGNTAANGGAIRIGGTKTGLSVTIKDCDFKNNEATNTSNGGGAISKVQAIALNATGCTFDGNKAVNGGALFINTTNAKDVVAENCAFANNVATKNGGAVYMHANCSDTVTINRCKMYLNTAVDGAAIYEGAANYSIITNNVIYNNGCVVNASKKYPAVTHIMPLLFANNTICFNYGRVNVASNVAKAVVANNIVWGNKVQANGTTDQTPTFTSASFNFAKTTEGTGCTVSNNFTQNEIKQTDENKIVINNNVAIVEANMGFEAPTDTFGVVPAERTAKYEKVLNANFALTSGSEFIDQGIDLALVTTDILGTAREAGKYDVGAYEYVSGGIGSAFENTEKAPLDIQAALQAGEVYNLLGQRVGELQAGNIYIVGGQKVLMQ
ncbi:MAG: hypothetical protein MR787_01455 [Bacteroidales bacterium]|nr:hypothetical protein [Bacteroidales bacterium]